MSHLQVLAEGKGSKITVKQTEDGRGKGIFALQVKIVKQ